MKINYFGNILNFFSILLVRTLKAVLYESYLGKELMKRFPISDMDDIWLFNQQDMLSEYIERISPYLKEDIPEQGKITQISPVVLDAKLAGLKINGKTYYELTKIGKDE